MPLNEMSKFTRLEILPGSACKALVDAFYSRHGSPSVARPDDLFFLALFNHQLIGCVRYCEEHETPMLRSMMIDQTYRQKGIGTFLLKAFESHLVENQIQNTHCIPYPHLDHFYGQIGFSVIVPESAPEFLFARWRSYQQRGEYLCMRRP